LNYTCYSDTTGDIYLTNGGTLNAAGNNITDNPLFIFAANGDFRIFGDSPCVNTGSNGFNTESVDVRGETRVSDGVIDRGAYEWTAGVDPANLTLTWTGLVSSDWNTAGNWEINRVPTAGDDVVIPVVTTQYPVVNEAPATPAVCNNLSITSGATVTIAAGKALMVNGNLNINTSKSGLNMDSGRR
jgi:hypothetical protein